MKQLLSLCALALAACLFTPDGKTAQGGGSDTETLTGLVTAPGGVPAARVAVKLLPSDYDPSHPDTSRIRKGMTDANGNFRFDKLAKDRIWNVIAGDVGSKSWALARNLESGTGSQTLQLSPAKVFLFSLHSTDYQIADSGIAFFPGTDILARCGGVSASKVDSVPMGAVRFIVESRSGWKHDTTLASIPDTTRVLADKLGITYTP